MSHREVQDIFRNSGTMAELEVARETSVDPMNSAGDADPQVQQAKNLLTQTLSPLLPPHRGVPMLPKTSLPQSLQDRDPEPHYDEVPLVSQPYRTTPLILPHAKTIHDTVPASKFLAHHSNTAQSQPYRNSCVALPAPRTLNDLNGGGTAYQQYRGPQYNTQMAKPTVKNALYNSPAPLYSEENLAEAAASHPGYVQGSRPQLPTGGTATVSQPQESHTFRMILESEMGGARDCPGVGGKRFDKSGQDRPSSQQSDKSSENNRSTRDPVMKDTSINQSASFKKVMQSVMGEF